MKFRDKLSGVIYEPTDEVAAMMLADPRLEQLADEPKKKPAARTRRKVAPKADETKE